MYWSVVAVLLSVHAVGELMMNANRASTGRSTVGETETARDLTQDVFLRVSRTAVPAASDGEVRAWLFKIARNLAIDHHRFQ